MTNSGSDEAQDSFAQGLAALHSFWYDAAREAFRRAQEEDPGFALAYWGEAMSHYRAFWAGNLSAGSRQLERLDEFALERLESHGTEEEKALIAAARELFDGGGKAAYLESLREATQRLPESVEIAAFYALALQGSGSRYSRRSEHDWDLIAESSEILERLYAKAPDHPGVLHYLIHAYDDPDHAELGLPAARSYASIAPDAPHAQHMPSHIFIQIGEWASSVSSNRRAWRASEIWASSRDLPDSEKDFHALDWLQYSLLQQGDFEAADELLEILRENGGSSSAETRYQARRLVESEQWTYAVEGSDEQALFARGYAAARRGELRRARSEWKKLDGRGGEEAEILGLALEGLIAHLEGDTRRGLGKLAEAADEEDRTRIPSGPPELVKPALELYGEVLLELGRCDEAVMALDRSLSRMPGRRLSMRAARRATTCGG